LPSTHPPTIKQGKIALEEEQDPGVSKKAAKALLRVLESSLHPDKSKVPASFLSPELLVVVPVLQDDSLFGEESFKEIRLRIIQEIQGTVSSSINSNASTMDPTYPPDSLSASGIADRVSPGSDPASSITNLLADIGPACTRNEAIFRETLKEFRRSSFGGIEEATMARLLYFFSTKGNNSNSNEASSGLSSSLLGSLLPGSHDDGGLHSWNLHVVQQVIRRDYHGMDWPRVARLWDFYDFVIRDTDQFRTLLDLYRAGAQRHPPTAALTARWQYSACQCSLLEVLLSVPAGIFVCELNEAETADAATAGTDSQIVNSIPNPRCWASASVLQCLLYLTEIPSISRRVRDLFIKGLLSCPEVILCSLIRLSLSQASDATVSVGKQMKSECMRELIPLFFKPNSGHRVQNGPAACRRVWEISPNTFTAACIEGWRSTAKDAPHTRLASIVHIISLVRLLPPPSPETALKLILEGQDPEFSISLYFVLADKANYQLKTWLSERATIVGVKFIGSLITYLAKYYQSAAPRSSGSIEGSPLVSLENMRISLEVLLTMDASVMSKPMPTGNGESMMTIGDSVKSLTEACVQAHPSIRTTPLNSQGPVERQQQQAMSEASGADDDIEEKANSYFQKIYTSEQSIGEVVEMLKRFKTSSDTRENEIFACMIRNLFDEYRFFSKYPEKELRITGILFGTLIKEQLVNSITLGIALRYVLEALRRPPSPPGSTSSSVGKMFRFGMFALEQFKERLHEWPQYCSHIVQIPHLKEGYSELVGEIESAMSENLSRQSPVPPGVASETASAASSLDGRQPSNFVTLGGESLHLASTAPVNPVHFKVSAPAVREERDTRVARFGPNLGRAVTQAVEEDVQHEAPPDLKLDKIQFLINNVSMNNVEQKAQELKDMLEPRYFDWLGHYLVVKRISAQPNFHSLYLTFLDSLGEYGKGLIQSILSSVYLNIGKLLRSPKITTSTSERSLLKNLGSWLGQITIARNRPILQLMLDCKELLFQGYENGRLIAVTPFVAKILEGAKNSVIFRPPNPWVMGLLGVFRSLYAVEDLKMNIKFEVEVLCKNLGIKLEDIPPRSEALAKRIPPMKERNPDFNMKSNMVSQSAPQPSATDLSSTDGKTHAAFSTLGGLGQAKPAAPGKEQQTVIPNLVSYVTINPSLTILIQQSQGTALASTMSVAALTRSISLALDRAIREIIQPVVERSVTIACITTKEIVNKDFATEGDESKMHKASQLMVANLAGSLALVTCRDPLRSSISTHLRQLLISAAGGTEKLSEQEQATVEQCVAIVATDNMELGCKLIEKAATEKAVRDVDDALAQGLSARRKHREQTGGQPYFDMTVLGNETQRYPGTLPEQLRPQRGGLRPEQLRVYEAFQRMPRQVQAATPPEQDGGGSIPARSDGDPSKGLNRDVLTQIAAKIDSSITAILTGAGSRAPEVTLSMLPAEHEVRQLLAAVPQVVPANISEAEKKQAVGFAQGVFRRLYESDLSEPLRLEALVALLEKMNEANSQLGQDLGTWTTYAPTETEAQRKLHRTVLLLLVRSNLVSPQELDGFLSSNSDNAKNPVWVEFSLLFIRTAFLERIASPSDFPQLMELMTNVADGRSQASPQVAQTLRKPILRMLEEVRGAAVGDSHPRAVIGPSAAKNTSIEESSILSSASLANLKNGARVAALSHESFSRNDHPNAKQQVTSLLDSWIRVHSEAAANEKALAQYLQLLQQFGVGKMEEQTERFFRLATQIVVDAVMKTFSKGGDGKTLNYTVIDIYSHLIPLVFRSLCDGDTDEQIASQPIALLNKALGCIVRCMMWDYEHKKNSGNGAWDQRPWFRLLLNLTVDMNSPDVLLDTMKPGILGVFGTAFHVIQPLVVPGFAFAWLELVSHRSFFPSLLLLEGQRGFSVVHQLLVDMLLFLEPHLRNIALTPAIKKLYEGTLRVVLVLLHDFPLFLSGYHLSLCNVIPENCVQLRNVVLSAVPKGIALTDPFTPNLKIDSLPEIGQSPVVLSNILGPLQSIRADLDAFLKDRQDNTFVAGLLPRLYKAGSRDVDAPRVNSLVLYVGMQAINRLQNSQVHQSLSQTPELEILQKLMELDDHGRYISLNAIANQLRYPSSHTHYFSCVMLYLFGEKNVAVKEQVTRVLLERLILHRPHPWGLLVTFVELIKNQRYQFWSHPFVHAASELEKLFESVARSCLTPGSQRSSLAIVGENSQ
jgi:CCR4-NOT transcription complex subunit 1